MVGQVVHRGRTFDTLLQQGECLVDTPCQSVSIAQGRGDPGEPQPKLHGLTHCKTTLEHRNSPLHVPCAQVEIAETSTHVYETVGMIQPLRELDALFGTG